MPEGHRRMTHPLVTELAADRRGRKIPRDALATDMHVSTHSLSNWENGRFDPTLHSLEKWANSLDYAVLLAKDGRPLRATYHRIVPALTEERRLKDVQQIALAARMGIRSVSLCRWEKERSTPSLASIDRWAAALDFTLVLVPRAVGGVGEVAS